MDNTKNEILTRKQVMKMLDISASTLWRWTESGDLKNLKIGNRVYFIYSDVINALNKEGGNDV
jgi:predicted DNA-binding transcriptional regulator AlpA|tara:strand:- start:628 stop:816 length:189 start_codon:yes stop_codon:yes gene_type:complete